MAGSNSDNEKNSDSSTTNIPTDFASQLQQFDFKDEAIDTALRKLLANVLLPKEAQQIDRAMEDFAKHYHGCNPSLTDNPDPIYAVAFSILLLHTDAHNKNVKRKMNKDTFIRRTRLIEGGDTVYSEVLDVMYDNIVFSEFTYAHDQQDKSSSWFSKKSSQPNITLLHDLYPKLEQLMPTTNTFSYKPSPKSVINILNVHQSIEDASTVRLAGVRGRQQQRQQQQPDGDDTYTVRVCKGGIFERKYDLTHGGKRAPARGWRPFGMILSGNQIMFFADLTTFGSWLDSQQQLMGVNTTLDSPSSPTSAKHLIQNQSSFSSNASSNASTPTTLTSFSTISSAQSYPINSTSDLPMVVSSATPISSPRSSTSTTSIITSATASSSSSTLHLRPVQIVSLSDAICLYDDAYQKYPNVFRLVTGDGQQFLIRGDSPEDVDDWIQKINYMAAMKTTGVRLRPKTLNSDESDMTPSTSHPQHQQQHPLPGVHYYYQHHQDPLHPSWAKRESKAKSKVISLSEKLAEHKRLLAKDEQLRNQLVVLTPMQKTTRDRMLLFADTIGKRILDQRIAIQRLECYREYIERELFYYQSIKTHGRPSISHNNSGDSSSSSNSNSNTQGKANSRNTISRKLSAPLPFYSGLLQTRSATPPATTDSPRLFGMTLAPNDIDTEAPTMRIPHRSSSLLMSLSCGGSNSSTTKTMQDEPSQHESLDGPHDDSTPPSQYQNPRVADVVRVSRQRSQSNPVPLVQTTDDDPNDSPSLEVPTVKKNRDRSVSEVTTDDEDFSIVVAHGEKDSLVNHVDRIVDVV